MADLQYGMAPIATAAEMGSLILAWPQPRLAVQTPDMLQMLKDKISSGFMSHLQGIQEIYNCDRATALEIVAQIAQDTKDIAALFPEMDKATGLPDPEPGPGGDDDSQKGSDDEDDSP